MSRRFGLIYRKGAGILALNTPKSRLSVWAFLTLCIYLAPFHWLQNLSLYKAVGFEQAPSIGLTRAYWYVLHGRFDEAAAMNMLIFAVLAVGLPLLLRDALRLKQKPSVH